VSESRPAERLEEVCQSREPRRAAVRRSAGFTSERAAYTPGRGGVTARGAAGWLRLRAK